MFAKVKRNIFISLAAAGLLYLIFSLYADFEKVLKESGFKIIKISKIGGFYAMAAQGIIEYLIRAFNLYSHEFWGRIFNLVFTVFGRLMIFFDKIDKSEANKKFAIAWLIICQKSIN